MGGLGEAADRIEVGVGLLQGRLHWRMAGAVEGGAPAPHVGIEGVEARFCQLLHRPIDAGGVVGQVTRVFPLTAEVTLLTDRDQSIPVLNSRTGARNVASGDILGGVPHIELKYVPASADVKEGDLLTTSGIDSVYPAGLQVARISQIERRVDISFARIHATPLAEIKGRHVLVLQPTGRGVPAKNKTQ